MYIQITTRCNMLCAHCCMRATAKGVDMPMRTYRNALKLAYERADSIAIGGGEPTVHPRLWEMIGLGLGSGVEYVWLATNGKKTNVALALAGLAKGNERFSVALSQDIYHEPIDHHVVETFRRYQLEIRDVSGNLSNAGRAADNNLSYDDRCVRPGLKIEPDGSIRPCGCEDAPIIGNVNDGGIRDEFAEILASDDYLNSECWTKYLENKEAEEAAEKEA